MDDRELVKRVALRAGTIIAQGIVDRAQAELDAEEWKARAQSAAEQADDERAELDALRATTSEEITALRERLEEFENDEKDEGEDTLTAPDFGQRDLRPGVSIIRDSTGAVVATIPHPEGELEPADEMTAYDGDEMTAVDKGEPEAESPPDD